jgi:excisionase family DNA binding protein
MAHCLNSPPKFQALLDAGGLNGKSRLTPREVSEVTGAPISTVRRWLREGRLTALRTGFRYRWILVEDLEAFLNLGVDTHE